ncbi:hypothetical protein [Paenibacillus durus]|uniref:Uncharacterized protein n=1 Tax=Paenibacillus durus TaxID=44251 RepID=A0A089HHX6_PAEDU|nr:hypothetical protein [Paenibacillus durus]AIQ11556.1 hypothetical protein PDUR_06035 [Paenibacillus durus]
MDSMTSVLAGLGYGPIPAVNTFQNDIIRIDRAMHPCQPFAEETIVHDEGGECSGQIGKSQDFPDHVRIHGRLQTLRALRALRASQAEKEREKGVEGYVL